MILQVPRKRLTFTWALVLYYVVLVRFPGGQETARDNCIIVLPHYHVIMRQGERR